MPHCRREADGAAGVGSERPEAQAGRGGDAGAARRRARPESLVPRVDRDVEVGVIGGHRSFGQVQLAEEHRSRPAEPRHDGRVVVGHEVRQDRGGAHRPDAARVAQVLDRDRHAVQRPAVVPGADLAVRSGGGRARLVGHHRRVAPEAPVDGRNAVEQGLGELRRRDLAALDPAGRLAQTQVVERYVTRAGCTSARLGGAPPRSPRGGARAQERSGGSGTERRQHGSSRQGCLHRSVPSPTLDPCGWSRSASQLLFAGPARLNSTLLPGRLRRRTCHEDLSQAPCSTPAPPARELAPRNSTASAFCRASS